MRDAPLSKRFKLSAVTVTRGIGNTFSIDVVVEVSGTKARYGLLSAYYTLKCSKYIGGILSGSVTPILSGFLGNVITQDVSKSRIFT
jgi:F420-0:gamma-glutamyl ligase-like protein